MVSALAHEVNQPLTALIIYISGIRRLLAAGKQDAAQQAMEQVAEQADRARQIIRGLRELVRKGEPAMRRESREDHRGGERVGAGGRWRRASLRPPGR